MAASSVSLAIPKSPCTSFTVNGKTRYFSSKNPAPLAGLKETAILAFGPIYGGFMLLLTLFWFWISTKTKGAAHWITLILALLSGWQVGKTGLNWFKAKDYMDKNTFDTCDAPAPSAPAEKSAYEKTMMSGAPPPVAKTA